MWQIPDTHSKFLNHLAGLVASPSTKFKLDSYYRVMVPNVIFLKLFALSDPKIQDAHPKINRHLA